MIFNHTIFHFVFPPQKLGPTQFFRSGLFCLFIAYIFNKSGDAFLPSGDIKVDDVVSNCSGNVALRHITLNKIIGGFNFK